MDPTQILGLIALSGSIAKAIYDCACKLYTFIQSAKGLNKELDSLWKDVNSWNGIMVQLHDTLKLPAFGLTGSRLYGRQ